MFQAPLAHLPPPQTPGAASRRGKAGTSEFRPTRRIYPSFSSPASANPPQVFQAGFEEADAPGEFTRFFEAQVHESHARMDLPPVQAAPAASRQGEFTKGFRPHGECGQARHDAAASASLPGTRTASPDGTRRAGHSRVCIASSAPPSAALPAAFSPNQAPAPPSSTIPAGQVGNDFTMRFSVAPALKLRTTRRNAGPASAPSTGNASSSGPGAAARWPLYLESPRSWCCSRLLFSSSRPAQSIIVSDYAAAGLTI